MRPRKSGRLADIAAAALAVFTRQGYRLTQMSDVAREAGVSAGALYSYVSGKEALLELALAHALGEVPPGDSAFESPGFIVDGERFAEKLRGAFAWPSLSAVNRRGVFEPADGEAVLGELFDLVSRRRYLIWLLDRCSAEVPELAGLYQTTVRGRYIADFTRFVALARQADDPADRAVLAVARALMEMTAWMGMHRLRDRQPPDVDDAQARAAVLEIASGALRPGAAAKNGRERYGNMIPLPSKP